VEVVTGCCKDVMIIINKFAGEIKTIVVGMETNLPAMEWPHSVAKATGQQLWLKEKLTIIEKILIKLLQGKLNCILIIFVSTTFYCTLFLICMYIQTVIKN